jgi:adenosylcobyric acid synthase
MNKKKYVVFRLPFRGRRNEFLHLAGDPACQVSWQDPRDYEEDADVIILPGSGKTISDLAYLRENGGEQIIGRHLAAGKSVIGICGGYQILGLDLFDPYKKQGNQEYVSGLGLLPIRTFFGPRMLKCQTKQKLLIGAGYGDIIQGVEVRSGISKFVEEAAHSYTVMAKTQERDFNFDLDIGPAEVNVGNGDVDERAGISEARSHTSPKTNASNLKSSKETAQAKKPPATTLKLANGEKVKWAPGTELEDGLVSPDRLVWGTYLHLIFHNESFRRTFYASLH